MEAGSAARCPRGALSAPRVALAVFPAAHLSTLPAPPLLCRPRCAPMQSAVPLDGSQSLLVFEGAVRVHGLFDFLLNESFRSHGDECDVPLLLAPVQFAQASLQAVQPKVGGGGRGGRREGAGRRLAGLPRALLGESAGRQQRF